jgi:hypothetical protein
MGARRNTIKNQPVINPRIHRKIEKSLHRNACLRFNGQPKKCFPDQHSALLEIRRTELPLIAYRCENPEHTEETWHVGNKTWKQLLQ